jgi:hypothetical protein
VRVELRTRDLEELETGGIDPAEALARGAQALGARRLSGRVDDPERHDERLADAIDAYAEADADFRLVRFDFATRAPAFDEAAARHRELGGSVRAVRLKRGPALAAELLQLRAREQTLERTLRSAGIDPETIAPSIPVDETSDLSYALLHVPRVGRGGPAPPQPTPRRRRFRRKRR